MGCCCSSDGDAKGAAPAVVTMDPRHSGPRVILSSFAISGEGTALASSSVEQERAYWEVRVLKAGTIHIGVSQARPRAELAGPVGTSGDSRAWTVELSATSATPAKEDDIIGVAMDQSERPVLRFTLNGEPMDDWTLDGIKGTVFPSVSVGKGAICDVCFTAGLFDFPTPERYSAIIPTRSLI